jgi:5,10-methenyltetrahydrofolate synthetase
MTAEKDDEEPGCFASPPCLMHEVDPAYMGLADAADPRQHKDVMRWRKTERERLIAERLAISANQRQVMAEVIAQHVEAAIGDARGLTVSCYWPFRGEPDLRGLMERIASLGAQCALPVVVERARPLIFRAWSPGEPLEKGIWNIPVPSAGAEVVPDIVIAPVVGFDRGHYRLGYGGGYYDRTLAAMTHGPRFLGVGYARAAISTIYPQPHDIPMDLIVTENGIFSKGD